MDLSLTFYMKCIYAFKLITVAAKMIVYSVVHCKRDTTFVPNYNFLHDFGQ